MQGGRRGFNSTKHSFVPETSEVASPTGAFHNHLLTKRGSGHKTSVFSDQQTANFTINQAKPGLFVPIQMQAAKVDSYVSASHVANAFCRPS